MTSFQDWAVLTLFFFFQNTLLLQRILTNSPLRGDTGGHSGKETQFMFSEGDVRDGDADLVNWPTFGEFVIPQSINFL